MISLKKYYRLKIITGIAALMCAANLYAIVPPAIEFTAVPANSNVGCVAMPVAKATSKDLPLSSVSVWYSWDNQSWSLILYNSTPSPTTYLGGCCGFSRTGTFYLKATAVDSASNTATTYASIPINPQDASAPSALAADLTSYNYGPAWMYDSSTNTQKCWWTAGYPYAGGGDCIVYAQTPLGSTPPSVSFSPTFGNPATRLISNPCVIKSPITKNGHTYSYAMYYTYLLPPPNYAETNEELTENSIGVALSDDGLSWPVYFNIINSITPDAKKFGAGIPSVIRLRNPDKSTIAWCMFNVDIITGDTLYVLYRESTDGGLTWPATSVPISTNGLQNFYGVPYGTNPVFAFYNNYWYLAHTTSSNEIKIYKMQATAQRATGLSTGTWTLIRTIPSSSGPAVKHNPGFYRDEDGYLLYNNAAVGYAGQKSTAWDSISESQLYYSTFSP